MPKVEVKTVKEHGEYFCELMNKDDDLTLFANKKLAEYIVEAARQTHIAKELNDVKAGSRAISDIVGEIMSFIAFMYAKAREKEDEMKKEV